VFYEFDLTIPANTPKESPAELDVTISAGTIEQIEVQLPRGLRSLVHTVAIRGSHQLWPTNPDGSIKGDDARIIWGENFPLIHAPFIITLLGWSPGTSFSHVVTWRFQVASVPVQEAEKKTKKPGLLSAFMKKGAS